MDLSIYLRYYSVAGIYFSFRWGPFVHSLEIVQWDSTRRDHPGNLGGVSGSGPVISNHPNIAQAKLESVLSNSILCENDIHLSLYYLRRCAHLNT